MKGPIITLIGPTKNDSNGNLLDSSPLVRDEDNTTEDCSETDWI
jgi:hypothetical protein